MTKYLSFTFLIFALIFVFSQEHSESMVGDGVTKTVTQTGISLGSVIAVVISWDRNKSLLWAIIHGILGWLYVIYYALTNKYPL